MNLNDLLLAKSFVPQQVLVLRHRPFEPELNKVLPWLTAEKPDVFNAYQQTQGKKVEKGMTGFVHRARAGQGSIRRLVFNWRVEAPYAQGILAGSSLH